MRSLRLDFTKGINSVTDPHILGKGFAVAIDNADVDRFTIRSCRAPVFRQEVPAGTVDIFEYRGKWHFSDARRDWAAEFVGSQERLYYSEKGKPPKKIIDGVEANLGIPAPACGLKVTETTSVIPVGLQVSVGTGGGLPISSAVYRVGYRLADGLLVACNPVTAQIATAGGSVTLTWRNPVMENVKKVVVYGRDGGKEQILEELAPGTESYIDNGSRTPSGQFASTMDNLDVFSYFYTFLRKVGGHLDESGPSPLFGPLQTFNARSIERLPEFEGLFSGTGATGSTVSTITGATVSKTSAQIGLCGVLDSALLSKTILTTVAAHGLSTGDEVGVIPKHVGIDTNTKNQVYFVSTLPLISAPSITSVVDGASGSPGFTGGVPISVRMTSIRGSLAPLGGRCAESLPSAATAFSPAGGKKVIVRWAPLASEGSADGFGVYLNGFMVAAVPRGTYFYEFDVPSSATIPVPTVNTSSTHAFAIKQDPGLVFDSTLAAASPVGYGSVASEVATTINKANHGLSEGQSLLFSGYTELNGSQIVDSVPTTGTFTLKVLTESDDSSPTGKSIQVASDALRYVDKWALYVASGSGGGTFLKQGEYPLTQTVVVDTKPASALGETCSSYYEVQTAAGPSIVSFGPPPLGLSHLTMHNNCLWGIRGHEVWWTPVNRPDAWCFYRSFPAEPVTLVSYAGAMIVLCLDGPWRFDGYDPANVTCQKTRSADGCIAPYSAQETAAGLIYLSPRGLVSFRADLGDTVPISEHKIDASAFTACSSSSDEDSWPASWIPTRRTALWAKLTDGLASATPDRIERHLSDILPSGSLIEEARSFYWRGKYSLYYTGERFGYHGTVVVDCSKEGLPVFSRGLKPVAAHVSKEGRSFVLASNMSPELVTELQRIQLTAENEMGDFSGLTASAVSLSELSKDEGEMVPFVIRMGPGTESDPGVMKKFRAVEINGEGRALVMIWVDNKPVAQGYVYAQETPGKVRRLNIPRGMGTGYGIDMMIAMQGSLLAAEVFWDETGREG